MMTGRPQKQSSLVAVRRGTLAQRVASLAASSE
jgi:hypothetical protein